MTFPSSVKFESMQMPLSSPLDPRYLRRLKQFNKKKSAPQEMNSPQVLEVAIPALNQIPSPGRYIEPASQQALKRKLDSEIVKSRLNIKYSEMQPQVDALVKHAPSQASKRKLILKEEEQKNTFSGLKAKCSKISKENSGRSSTKSLQQKRKLVQETIRPRQDLKCSKSTNVNSHPHISIRSKALQISKRKLDLDGEQKNAAEAVINIKCSKYETEIVKLKPQNLVEQNNSQKAKSNSGKAILELFSAHSSSLTATKYSDRFLPPVQNHAQQELTQIRLNEKFSSSNNEKEQLLIEALTGLRFDSQSSLLNCPNDEIKSANISTRDPNTVEHHPEIRQKFVWQIPSVGINNVNNNHNLNILSVSKEQVLALVIDTGVVLKNIRTSETIELVRTDNAMENQATSVCWIGKNLLALGTRAGILEVWDTTRPEGKKLLEAQIRKYCIETVIGVGKGLLTIGSEDGSIVLIRISKINNILTATKIQKRKGHEGHVSGLALSRDGSYLASGSSDETVKIWNFSASEFKRRCTLNSHQGSIKALAWNPNEKKSNLLATGGRLDESIRLWDAITGNELCRITTCGQIFGLYWLPCGKYLISTHGRTDYGFSSNKISLWKYSKKGSHSLKEIPLGDDKRHADQILFSAFSNDGKVLFTLSADQTLKCWNIKSLHEASNNAPFTSNEMFQLSTIR